MKYSQKNAYNQYVSVETVKRKYYTMIDTMGIQTPHQKKNIVTHETTTYHNDATRTATAT